MNPHLYSILVLLLKVASSPHEDSHLNISCWLYDIIESELLDSYQMLMVNIFKDGFDRTIFHQRQQDYMYISICAYVKLAQAQELCYNLYAYNLIGI